jgi:hypothetical protein
MPSPLLDKWQTNDIFKAIQEIDLDPGEFDLDTSDADVRVKPKSSDACFIIGGRVGHYVGRYVFGNNVELQYERYSWDSLMSSVKTWLNFVKLDLDTPDLWAELRRETKLLGAISDDGTENRPFTQDEQREIAGRLRELEVSVRQTYSLSEAQMQSLDDKVDYLIAATGRLGRKDWLNAFVGVLFGFVVTAALAPETARGFFVIFLRAIGLLAYPELLLD